MVRVTQERSGSGCVGIFDIAIAFIKNVVVSRATYNILMKARQGFVKAAVIKISKYKHGGVRFIL